MNEEYQSGYFNLLIREIMELRRMVIDQQSGFYRDIESMIQDLFTEVYELRKILQEMKEDAAQRGEIKRSDFAEYCYRNAQRETAETVDCDSDGEGREEQEVVTFAEEADW